MAAKKPTKKVKKAKKGVEVNLIPSDEIVSNRVYANYVQVSNSPFDVTLRFCDVPPISNIEKVVQDGGAYEIPVVAEIAIPFDVMPALIKILQDQHKTHKAKIKGK